MYVLYLFSLLEVFAFYNYNTVLFMLFIILAEPNFTIPLTDKHMDNQADLIWTCEAFGVPDVTYKWFKNGEPIEIDKLQPDDQKRYLIQDNVLSIKYLDAEKDSGMYQCEARNTLKARYSSAQLRVLCMFILCLTYIIMNTK